MLIRCHPTDRNAWIGCAEPKHHADTTRQCVHRVADAVGYDAVADRQQVHLFVWGDDDAHV